MNYISMSDQLRSSGMGVSGGTDWKAVGKAAAGSAAKGGSGKKVKHQAVPMMALAEAIGPGLLQGVPVQLDAPSPNLNRGRYGWRQRFAPEITAPPAVPTQVPLNMPSRPFGPGEGPSFSPMPGRDWMEFLIALRGNR